MYSVSGLGEAVPVNARQVHLRLVPKTGLGHDVESGYWTDEQLETDAHAEPRLLQRRLEDYMPGEQESACLEGGLRHRD